MHIRNKNEIQTHILITSLIGLAVFALAGWYTFNLPIVQTSTYSGHCIRVIPPSAGTCHSLPARYHHEWVK